MKTRVAACALVSAMTIAPGADASFTETFEGGSNIGGWAYGGPGDFIPTSGGNPGAFLRTNGIDTIAPQPHTTGTSVFTGDYRAAGVRSIGVDLNTFTVDFSAADRPLTIMLISDNGTPGDQSDDWAAYLIGPDTIPVPGEGWKSFDFNVPADQTALPAGWATLQFGPNSPASPDWNDVITNVSELRFFYGDPTLFFIFQMWSVGLDNARITTVAPCPADLNGDGTVGAPDLALLLGSWGGDGPADLDASGAVGAPDLALLLGSWGACP